MMKRMFRNVDRASFAFGAIWLAVVSIIVTILGTAVIAQVPSVFITSPTGLEQINVVTTTGPQIYTVRLSQLRDAGGYTKLVPLTGQTIAFANNTSVLQLTPAGGLTALTVTTPTLPWDGQRIQVFTTQTITTFNLTAATGQTVNGNLAGSFSANTSVEYLYSLSNTTWDRIS